jgi:hypothetical protein
MNRSSAAALAVISVAFIAGGANAANLPISNANCPWANPNVSWRTYISTQRVKPRDFSIILTDRPEAVPDSEPWKGKCYMGEYDPDRHILTISGSYSNLKDMQITEFQSDGKYVSRFWNYDAQKWDSISGDAVQVDPARFKLQVIGGEFTYNEAGEVVHREYGLVGHLACYLVDSANPCMRGAR